MIIKLQLPATATATRQQVSKAVEQPTRKDRVKADRIVIAIIYLLGIIGAAVFA